MNNCGKRFRGEAAKFRFLNELIKVLSPKVRVGAGVRISVEPVRWGNNALWDAG